MEKKLFDCQTFMTRESVCKWVNQYRNLINIISITFDSVDNEFVVFFDWV